MSTILRSRVFSVAARRWKLPPALGNSRSLCSSPEFEGSGAGDVEINDKPSCGTGLLSLEEVKKILDNVHADDVRVLPVPKHYDFADHMVVATGRSEWHVRNIAQAIIYSIKQKQKGANKMVLPNVEGQEVGKWIVIDSGNLVIHALDEKVRAYYNLEELWSKKSKNSNVEEAPDLDEAFVKMRPKNNSKKRPQVKA